MNAFERRRFIKALPCVIGGTVLLAGRAAADALVTKASVSYQATPSGGQKCSLCRNFIASAPGADGTCKVVAGAISPNGDCLAFSPA